MIDLGEGEAELVAAVTRFVDDEVRPVAGDRDRAGEYPADLVARMRELGLFGLSRRPAPVVAAVMEELARGWVSLFPMVNAHMHVLWAVDHHGTPEQRSQIAEELAAGRRLAAVALSEPGVGSDLVNVASRGERVSGGWRLNADKRYITHARNADVLLLLVRTDQAPERPHRGLSLFLLERGEWEVTRDLDKLGTRSVETTELEVRDVVVGDDRLLGARAGHGFAQIAEALELGRIAVAAGAVGIGRAAIWAARDYAVAREAFGTTIFDHQAVRYDLAAIAAQVAAAKALTHAAARRRQEGRRIDAEAAMAKLVASETAVQAALEAIRVLGGAGYLTDNEPERLLRDSGLFLLGEGTSNIMKRSIARWLADGRPSVDWL